MQSGGGGKAIGLATAAACLLATDLSSARARATDGLPTEAAADPNMIWLILLTGFAIFACLAAIIVWIVSALERAKRSNRRNTAFVHSALNNMSLGIVMVDARNRLMFCNDSYLRLYGLARSELRLGMSGHELFEMRKRVSGSGSDVDEFLRAAASEAGYVTDLPDGRAIVVKHRGLRNGGTISTHEDVTEQRNLSRQLATTKRFLESVIDNIPVCVAAKSIEDGRYILANRAFEHFSQLPREQVIGKLADEIFTLKASISVNELDRAAIESPTGHLRSEFSVERDGQMRVLDSNRVVARNDSNEPEFLIALFEDVTERRNLSSELENTKKFLEMIIDNIPLALDVKRVSDGQYLFVNRSAEKIFHREREAVIGSTVEEIYGSAARLIVERDNIAIRKKGATVEEQPIQTRNGLRLFLTRRVTVLDDAGEPEYLIKTNEDITDRRQTESRMAHMAYHDPLTDLPNRAAFIQALTQMIDACSGSNEEFAVLSVDMDRLKEINDVFGHATGDQLLVGVSRRIQEAARGGVVARLSGDEFGLIIDGPQPRAGLALAEQLMDVMGDEFIIDGKSMRTGLTIGVSIFPRNGTDAASLLANASLALFRAKAKGRGSVIVFEAETDQQIRDRRVLLQELAAAVRNGQLSLYYQPQAFTGHGVIDPEFVGFEALARWIHPTRGFVPPGDFIPLAEESGLIVELGEWILREACREAASWEKPMQVAVNLSPAQFKHGDLVGLVHSILLETGLQPGRLELEITEGVLIDDFDRGLSLLRRLKALGVRIAMDDFGSGYSSLTYLQAFPFDKIKIDRTFVLNLGRNAQSAAIIRAMIGLGHGLDISIVAEGVETQEQLTFLAQENCDQVQGYLLGRPAPIAQYAAVVGAPWHEAEARKTG
ncbi:EAL domain-containing protein [Bradyrhizobium sp. U87765 SZCCT0131]|uniref:sensor domain-containing protein n=1 Tax=unclassified Bradyrhizobium TaxID=2631580 RepID=UPI001BADDFB3|nr:MULTISPECIES: EAL domain-containing protein [unclassified Bradyrhizobium]MBR1221917.1 EAL domain-containing protein [Bradyrhizobium sp. U87765 SZCCT0131]MBR1263885.1 EAL domain-containing protein [Bradyrhizobium sp. U87765 SZCCT0134]MBR1302545.1 EAL domain-containing protein [Bradyrhizobium sp. U87765 SZCCT0110]MBR1320135.1 EAL domain-containing protein [Bradyrhizobium sp. U87765 SZCCT0109]MBR1348752.1 EAL domain-containing protein [Bradyrhizobium sp. U87765 SZCCT0048]